MEERAHAAASRQDERFERREALKAVVDRRLETLHLRLAHAEAAGRRRRGRRRELATEVEELVLQPAEDVVELAARGGVRVVRRELGLVGGARHADRGVQLVDGAVGFDPRAVFSDPLAADEA